MRELSHVVGTNQELPVLRNATSFFRIRFRNSTRQRTQQLVANVKASGLP